MIDSLVTTSEKDAVLFVTLNRPERAIPVQRHDCRALAAIESGNEDPNTRVIVIKATGPAFSAGHDLGKLGAATTRSHLASANRCSPAGLRGLMTSILHAPNPSLPAYRGSPAPPAANWSLPAIWLLPPRTPPSARRVNIGTFCTTPLVVSVGIFPKAMEMALTGDQFDAATAERFGLINRSVPASELEQATRELAGKIASRSAESIARGKSAFYRQVEMPLDKAFELANQVMRDNLTADGDAQEGIGAFLEKRDPDWS